MKRLPLIVLLVTLCSTRDSIRADVLEHLDFESGPGAWQVSAIGSARHDLSAERARSGDYSYRAGPSSCGVNCFNGHMVTLTRNLDGTPITGVTFYLYEQGNWGGKCRLRINGAEVGDWNPRPNGYNPQPGWVRCDWSGDVVCEMIEIQAWDLTSSNRMFIDDIYVFGIQTAPVIAPIPNEQIVEHVAYRSPPPVLEAGTGSVVWSLVDAQHENITIDSSTGVVSWNNPVLRSEAYEITICAENDTGHDQTSWLLTVLPSYFARVQADVDLAAMGTPVNFMGRAEQLDNGQPAGKVEVAIHIDVKGTRRTITTETDESGLFSILWQPLAQEAGLYSISADHPKVQHETAEDQFVLVGIACEPDAIQHTVAAGQQIEGYATIRNLGDVELTGLSAQVKNAPANVSISLGSCPQTLAPEQETAVAYTIAASDTSSSNTEIDLVFSSDGGAMAKLHMIVAVTPTPAALAASPILITAGMVRGEQSLVQFVVTNTGGSQTSHLEVDLPDAAWLSLVTPTRIPALSPGEDATVELLLSPDESMLLGPYDGSLAVAGAVAGIEIPFHFECISQAVGTLKITTVDEFTFYADGEPRVAGAEVTLTDPHTGELVGSGVTDDAGEVIFPDLMEAYYDLEVRAPQHGRFQSTVLVQPGETKEVMVFLPRQIISYNWTVLPSVVPDHYEFELEAVFETNIPVPVISVDPPIVNLRAVNEETIQVDYTLTNHGLATAHGFTLTPGSDPRYLFEPLTSEIGDIPAQSSVVVPVLITKKDSVAVSAPYEGVGPFGLYYILCGGKSFRAVPFPVICDGTGPAGAIRSIVSHRQAHYVTEGYIIDPNTNTEAIENEGFRGSPGDPIGPTYSFSSYNICDDACFWQLADCAMIYVGEKLPRIGIANEVVKRVVECSASDDIRACVISALVTLVTDHLTGLGAVSNWETCLRALIACLGDVPGLKPVLDFIEEQLSLLHTIMEPYRALLDDDTWFDTPMTATERVDLLLWLDGFRDAVDAASDEGQKLANTEQSALIEMPLPSHITKPAVQRFMERWNRTIDYWESGITAVEEVPEGMSTDFLGLEEFRGKLEQAAEVESDMLAAGYTHLFDGIDDAVAQSFNQMAEMQGICASVRIHLDQSAVISRDAFTASLELSNEGLYDPMESISVTVEVQDEYGNFCDNLFAVFPPELSGIDDIDGSGTLPPSATGTAQWLIVPTSEAAPSEPKLYYISGELSYVSGGETIRIPLYPTPITVLPSPSLQVKYFLERDVYSDDPFTPDVVEPAVPFALGLMMTNTGGGAARDVRITSSQPAIVENEKGLLIDFQIIGTQIGMDSVKPSLAIDLGDIGSGQTAVAQWSLISSLQGRFVEYDADFVHVDGLGDRRLSLVDSVEIHELVHVVRGTCPDDDGICDFLTNDADTPGDTMGLPDTIYFSNTGCTAPVTPLIYDHAEVTTLSDSLEVTVYVPDVPNDGGYFYARWPAPTPYDMPILSATRADGKEILLDKNIWITHRTIREQDVQPYEEHLLHLLDCGGPGEYVLRFGDPSCDKEIVVVDVTTTPGGTVIEPGVGRFPYCPPTSRDVIAVVMDPNYCFWGWTGTAVTDGYMDDPTAAHATLAVEADCTLRANFRTLPILEIASADGGSVTLPGEGEFAYDYGQVVEVHAEPDPGWEFDRWEGSAVENGKVQPNATASSIMVTVDADYDLTATFAYKDCTLTVSRTSGGEEPPVGVLICDCGTIVPIKAVSQPCYRFTEWTGSAVDANKVADPKSAGTTVTVDADYTLIANFMVREVHLTIDSDEHGSVITPGDGAFWYDCGEVVCLTVEADPDYHFVRWEGSAVDAGKVAPHETDPDACVTMDDSYTLTAVFESNCAPRYDFPMDANPGWSLEGQWAFGVPTGQRCGAWGNNDPIGGYTGHNVLGVNLDGCYEAKIGGPYYATAGPFDLSEYENVTLRFWRWLNCDIPEYVKSTVEVSTDGLNWTVLWTQGERQEITDTQWTLIEYPLPQADSQATAYLRWGYEVIRERAYAYTGWNIDDVQLIGCVNGER